MCLADLKSKSSIRNFSCCLSLAKISQSWAQFISFLKNLNQKNNSAKKKTKKKKFY